jgi:hypothetical protein
VRRLHLIVAIAATIVTGRASAQGLTDLPSGTRVRIMLPDSTRQAPLIAKTRTVIGTMVRATSDTLWLQVAGPDTLRVPRVAVRRIDVSRGVSRSRSAVEGGLLMGLAVGLSARATATYGEVRHDAIEIAALGAVVGTVLGALQPYEHWRRVR